MQTILHYCEHSTLRKKQNSTELILSQYNESYEENSVPCFFWGRLTEPYFVARSLLTLSKIVSANFMPQASSMRDPVITAGGGKLRFEAFSSCCSVYGKIDILPEALDGEFLQNGTTNVDFNTEMISSLSRIRKNEQLYFSLGHKDVVLQSSSGKVVEKKVTLPLRWIKGMTTVQILSASMKKSLTLDRMQTQLLFKAIPKGDVKEDFYLTFRGKRPQLSSVGVRGGICIGAVQRLRLMETVIPLTKLVTIYTMDSEAAVVFLFDLGSVRFTLMLSRSHWRGFSGEGAALENLTEDIPGSWIEKLDTYAKANEEFGAESPLIKELPKDDFSDIAARLSAMGLLGYDLHENCYYYRKLPFKLNRIESLNPRYKNALKLIQKGRYRIITNSSEQTEVEVQGAGVVHKVLLMPDKNRCTCTWFATHQGDRGECKHMVAAKILKKSSAKEIETLLEELAL